MSLEIIFIMKIVYILSLKVECLSNLWIRQISVLYGRYFHRLFVSMFFNIIIKLHLTSGNNVELCCCKSFGSVRLRLIVYHKVFMTSIAIMQQSCIDYCIIITIIFTKIDCISSLYNIDIRVLIAR